MGGYNVEKNVEKNYLIKKIVDILKSIDDIELLKYFYYFIQIKAEKKAR